MRGDLDWIVMKAMEKDRTRRYQSASEFSADIERYLGGQPVMAGPPSVAYRFRKFVQRHRLGVTAAALIAAALVTGLSVATAGLVEARQEARTNQRIADFLQDLFVSTNPEQAIAEDADVESVLITAREIFGENHAAVAATLSSRALQLQSSGDLEAAEELYGQSLRIWREQFGAENANVGSTLTRLGLLLMTKGDNEGAEEAFRESLRITRAQVGDESLVICEPMALLGSVLATRGEFDEAESLFRESARIREAVAPHQRLQIALTYHQLANTLALAGRIDELREFAPTTIAAWREALADDSVILARILTEYGILYLDTDNAEAAETLLRDAVAIFNKDDQAPTHLRASAVRGLYRVLEKQHGPAETIPIAMEAVDLARELDSEERLHAAVRNLHNLGWNIAKQPGRTEAEYRIALEAVQKALAEEPDTPAYVNTLGVLKYRFGDYEGALETLTISNAHYAQEFEGGAPCDLAFMAMTHARLGQDAEARALMDKLRAAMRNPASARSEDNWSHLAEAEAFFADPGKEPAPTP
jgi:tetratricopeptide (TPR) repeat protein